MAEASAPFRGQDAVRVTEPGGPDRGLVSVSLEPGAVDEIPHPQGGVGCEQEFEGGGIQRAEGGEVQHLARGMQIGTGRRGNAVTVHQMQGLFPVIPVAADQDQVRHAVVVGLLQHPAEITEIRRAGHFIAEFFRQPIR